MGQVVSLEDWKAAKPKTTETTIHLPGVVITFKIPPVIAPDLSPYDAAVAWRKYFWGF